MKFSFWIGALAILAGVAIVLLVRFSADREPSSSTGPRRIQGVVTAGGLPVAGATVRIRGASRATSTDAVGRFDLGVAESSPPVRITASAPGKIIAGVDWTGTAAVALALKSFPIMDSSDYVWAPSHTDSAHAHACGNCHGEIVREWSASSHANSAKNRHFFNVFDGSDWQGRANVGWNLMAEYPAGAGVCYSCHVPSPEPTQENIAHLQQVSGVHRDGVHCDFCHKVADVDVRDVGRNHGRFAMRHIRPAPDNNSQLFFGPLDDVDRGEDVYRPIFQQSAYCASCHEGILFGVHAYSTYSEWQASPYPARGIECQSCHMAASGQMTNMAPGKGGIERDPRTLATHSFPGRAPDFLRGHIKLSMTAKRMEQGIEAVVTVLPHGVGHSLPTGHPSRNLIVWLDALDDAGRRLPLVSGPTLPPLAGSGSIEEGGLVGLPGRFYAKTLEGLDGSLPVPYWRPNRLQSDTRLKADEADRQTFLFSSPPEQVTLTARLVYRRFSWFEARQKGWPDNETLVAEQRIQIRAQGSE